MTDDWYLTRNIREIVYLNRPQSMNSFFPYSGNVMETAITKKLKKKIIKKFMVDSKF